MYAYIFEAYIGINSLESYFFLHMPKTKMTKYAKSTRIITTVNIFYHSPAVFKLEEF